MPRYRLKSDEEMAWNVVRRAATARIRLEAAAWMERRLNDILPELQLQFRQLLQTGVLPQLEAEYETWLDSAIRAMKEGLPESGEPDGGGK
jgi:hypothetical protein